MRLSDTLRITGAALLALSVMLPFGIGSGGENRISWHEPLDVSLFFLPLALAIATARLHRRWARVALSLFALAPLPWLWFLVSWLATYKAQPLIGYHVARLAFCLLCVGALFEAFHALSQARGRLGRSAA